MGDERGIRRSQAARQLTRRRFIGAGTLLGVGALLAACGATAQPTTAPTLAPTPGSAATSTRPPAGPSAATRTPTGPPVAGSATALERLLGLLPQADALPGRNGIWFADVERQKRNYGYERITSPEAAQALPGGLTTFTNAVGRLPIPTEAGANQALNSQWRSTLGYDYWQIARTIGVGDPPRTLTRLEGAFDRAAIEATLLGQDYMVVPYRERAYLSRLGDGELVLSDPIVRLVLNRLNRVALEAGALTAAPFTATIEAAIEAAGGLRPTFAADPDHAALALALGPVVGAILAPPDGLYRPMGSPTRATATPRVVRTATPALGQLHPYRLVGLGLRDDGTTHTMVIALVYDSAADARADAPLLHGRVEGYTLLRSGQPLSTRARPGEPEIVAAGGRVVLVQPFAIAAEADLGLYVQLFTNRDLLFLAR